MKTVADRLKAALGQWKPGGGREPSIRLFQQEIARREDVKGTSYTSVHSYFGGGAPPPLSFLEAAAEILGVRVAWLAFGAGGGEPTEEAERRRRMDEAQVFKLAEGEISPREFQARRDAEWLAEQVPGDSRQARRHRAAVLRFAHKLSDATFPDAPWEEEEDRRELLGAALTFLQGVEAAFERAGRQDPDAEEGTPEARFFRDDLLRSSASEGWYVVWSDAVLDLFSRRVDGLGERAKGLYDSHSPLTL